jgi:DUF1680 family protein
VNGVEVEDWQLSKGYARVNRRWRAGDTVELDLPMAVQRVAANMNVDADRGCVALQRGPIVYCLEDVDNNGQFRQFSLARDSKLAAEHCETLLGGVTVIKGETLLHSDLTKRAAVPFTAVPYYAWDNRSPGSMVVWLPEN